MNIQRFTAATSREALAKARLAFGEGTLILSNRPTENGVEVVATAEDSLASLDQNATAPSKSLSARTSGNAPFADPSTKVEDDAAQLAMSTLSFQDYVRERMLRRRAEASQAQVSEPRIIPAPEPEQRPAPKPAQHLQVDTNLQQPKRVAASTTGAVSQGIANELQALKEMMEDRFNTLTWLGQAKQNPIQSNLMLKLIKAGYSPALSRTILERLPEDMDAPMAQRWVTDVLERNLRTDAQRPSMHDEGGVFALVGATGVGKTTTAAKLAGLCARTHGPSSVGLITLDTYRVGAHEQLRAYGKMLGVVAHLAHDKAALQDLLGLLSNKKMVLIDTTGLAPRDPRKRDLLELLDIPSVKKVLVLNAGGHGDTIDDAVMCFKSGLTQETILSKTDEAVKLGPVLDATIRHQLTLRGVTTGQRVPEDWEPAVAEKLIRQSLRSDAQSAFDPKATDLGFFFSQPTNTTSRGRLHA